MKCRRRTMTATTRQDDSHRRFILISFITVLFCIMSDRVEAFAVTLPFSGPVATSRWRLSASGGVIAATDVADEGTEKLQQTSSSSSSSSSINGNPFIGGPSIETKPDYDNIIGPLGRQVDNLFMMVFRGQLAKHAGIDSDRPYTDYQGIMEIASALNQNFQDRKVIQKRAQATLQSIFPPWLPGAYAQLFSKPFPRFSARMNAWATWWAGTWLMGECEINDVIIDGGELGKDQGLLVKRCRFLEEAGCASVCVNSCKIPTQNFFLQDMGLPLTMEPNYETFECQFSFGKTPNSTTEMDAVNTPCLARCPTAGALREWHIETKGKDKATTSQCQLMEN